MARGILSEDDINILKKNPNVVDVDETRIIYSNEFKLHFVEEYMTGKKPRQIFCEAGLDPKILGGKRIERAAARWKESYAAGTLGKRKSWKLTPEEERLQKKIEKLEEENEHLKQSLAEINLQNAEQNQKAKPEQR